ncbi:STM3941 family protein [Flavobacterium sp. SUN046]|uniref:STM3941 family protein n=1 Tax=Flavobacterium sp. SUN046 TaxID=3002440 RepID=UPI002DB5C847|nr:STM3941 family protein [Flavobacterium sp. SUN046]MEC4049580.1 STM3941 family protein [Flavobacterium sp. SUN046]
MKLNNSNTEQIEIPLDTSRILLMLIGSIWFVFLGFWLFFYQAKKEHDFDPLSLQILGVVCMLFFSLTMYISVQKLLSSKKGLIINDQGIIDNSNGTSIGLIEWEDIVGIHAEEVMNNQFIIIVVKNPEQYLAKANYLKAKMMQANMKLYHSPLSITVQTLKIDFKSLHKLILKEYALHSH